MSMQPKRKAPPQQPPPPRQPQPRPSSSIPSAPPASNEGLLPRACVMASLDVDPTTGVDPILYKGPLSQEKLHFQRKPPHLDRRREYEANAKSHQAARATVAMLSERHAQRQIELEETFERDLQADKFRTNFIETRLATCGEPSLNTMDVRIARERDVVNTTSATARNRAKSSTDNRIRQAIRHAYGSGVLDLKALELVHIPGAVYSTLLFQLGRFISQVNVSRNALREIPEPFVTAFLQVTSVNYKENALDRLPRAMDKLTHLTELNAECNQLRMLPVHLPPKLQKLVLSRNRLTNVPHMHELLHLVELDLSHNHLQLLPPGMPYLSRLTKLVLNGNRLVSLALLPKFLIPEKKERQHGDSTDSDNSDDEDGIESWPRERIEAEQKKWRVESDPLSGDTVYFHLARKRVARVKPRCFRNQVPLLAIGKTASVAKLKKSHAQWIALFPDGWEVTLGGTCINKDGGYRPVTMANQSQSRPESSAQGGTGGELQSMQLCFTHHLTDESFHSIPAALDKWSELHRINSLHLSGNQLLDLPPSIGKLVRLKLLDVENNKILSLPDSFHEMKALETVKLAMNALSWLPPSFCSLPNLTDLDVKLNRFRGLPEEFGLLPRLKTLDLSSNSLESLPKSMLSLKKLATLRLQGNQALVKCGLLHAETLASGDIPQVFWHLSHQILVEQVHGGQFPPASESVVVGVGDEVWSTNHHVHRAFTQAIAQAQHPPHCLDFHWKNLGFSSFPPMFFSSLSKLTELRLSGQDLETIPAEFARVCSCLRVLHLRKNRIRTMDDGVFDCAGLVSLPLVELDLEYNLLEMLPASIGKLTELKSLRASNNRLQDSSFPETFAKLTALQELHLTHNRLTQPSPTFSSLIALEKLDLSYNLLTTLSTMAFGSLRHLYQLRVNVNQLTDIPEELANAPIQELYIAGNQLHELPQSVLLLKNSLRVLRMQSNKISRLPLPFGELTALDIVEADGNPFRSPPPEIMNMGIRAIRQYLNKRQQRVNEIQRLLETVRFPFRAETFLEPKLTQLLARDQPEAMKFLTEKHFCTFEKAIDAYVNGPFYLLPSTLRGADLVTELLLQKQFYLAQSHRAGILRDLVKLCALIHDKKWLDKVDFRFDLQRPWGRLGEECAVYALNPRALYDDQPQLPSVLSVIKKRVYHGFEDEAFVHSESDVADAIENYVGVYGPVGVIHDEVPFKCGCEDLLRFNKKHEPCYRAGWSFVQVVYSQEEADRRVSDEATIQEALRALRPQILTFLQTNEGEKRFHQEVKKIKNTLRQQLKDKKQKLKKLKRKYEPLKAALDKAKKKELETPSKETKTLAQVTEDQEREERIKALGERVTEMAQEYDKGKQQLGQGYSAFMEDVVTVLMEKIGVEVRNHFVQQQRQRAIDFGLRRPWDGPNGRDFEMYKQLVRRKMLSDGSMEKEDGAAHDAAKDGASPREGADREERKSDNSEISDVSFDGYEDLVSNLTAPGAEDVDGGDDDENDRDDDEEENEVNEAERAAALAKIEVSDVSADSGDEANDAAESEDSEL